MVTPRRPTALAGVLALTLLLLLAATPADAATKQRGAAVNRLIAQAEAAQAMFQDFLEPVTSFIVPEAPAVNLTSGDGDVATTGPCQADVTATCRGVAPGEGRLADCLDAAIAAESTAGSVGRRVSPACRADLHAFVLERSQNINANVPLATACAHDASTHCASAVAANNVAEGNDSRAGAAVVECLKRVRMPPNAWLGAALDVAGWALTPASWALSLLGDKGETPSLTAACDAEVFKAQLDAARDLAADPLLRAPCAADAARWCGDVDPGDGRVQSCLRDHRMGLAWPCREALFRRELEDAGDARLSVALVRKCAADVTKFCAGVPPGHGAVEDCLENRRSDAGFTPACRDEIEVAVMRRAGDFRLDRPLLEACADDVDALCGVEAKSLGAVESSTGRVVKCLQDYREEIVSPACAERVKITMVRAGSDIRFAPQIAEICLADRTRLCASVPPGSARVLRCLGDARANLSESCRSSLFAQEVALAEDIDFKGPLKRACASEIARWCSGIPGGHDRTVACLQDRDDDATMSGECAAEVKRDEIRSSADMRLNAALDRACDGDAAALCDDACPNRGAAECNGLVLACLQSHAPQLKSAACGAEVFRATARQARDFRVDPAMAAACAGDVAQLCVGIPLIKVSDCLAARSAELSPACAAVAHAKAPRESFDVRLLPALYRTCGAEMAVHCKGVRPGGGRVFRCLVGQAEAESFTPDCLVELRTRQRRRAGDWRLDPSVASACEADVHGLCGAALASAAERPQWQQGAVLKCLVASAPKLTKPACRAALAWSVRSSLLLYVPGAPLVAACDAHIAGSGCLLAAPTPPPNGGDAPEADTRRRSILQAAESDDDGSTAATPAADSTDPSPAPLDTVPVTAVATPTAVASTVSTVTLPVTTALFPKAAPAGVAAARAAARAASRASKTKPAAVVAAVAAVSQAAKAAAAAVAALAGGPDDDALMPGAVSKCLLAAVARSTQGVDPTCRAVVNLAKKTVPRPVPVIATTGREGEGAADDDDDAAGKAAAAAARAEETRKTAVRQAAVAAVAKAEEAAPIPSRTDMRLHTDMAAAPSDAAASSSSVLSIALYVVLGGMVVCGCGYLVVTKFVLADGGGRPSRAGGFKRANA